jgi:hypothetical protein
MEDKRAYECQLAREIRDLRIEGAALTNQLANATQQLLVISEKKSRMTQTASSL